MVASSSKGAQAFERHEAQTVRARQHRESRIQHAEFVRSRRDAVRESGRSTISGLIMSLAVALVMGLLLFVTQAAQAVTLPDTGVNVAEYITAAVTGLAAIVAAVVGAYFAFLLIRKGITWARRFAG